MLSGFTGRELCTQLLLPVAGTALLNLAVRVLLEGSGRFTRSESCSRVAAAVSSALVCLLTLRAGEAAGTASYFGYLLSDTAASFAIGPRLRPEILLHHVLTGALCLAAGGFLVAEPLALAPQVSPLVRGLLLMEASNPFMHAAWVADKEPDTGYRRAIQCWAVPGVLGSFFWLRVVGAWRCLGHAAALGGALAGWHAPVVGAVAALGGLQVWWFQLLLAMVLRSMLAPAAAGKSKALRQAQGKAPA